MTTPVYEPARATGNGATEDFPFTFPVESAEHIVVTVQDTDGNDSTLVQGVSDDYTVELNADGTGTVTLVDGPLTADYLITIEREVPLVQSASFAGLRSFHGASHDAAFDKAMRVAQQITEKVNRSIQLSRHEDPADFTLVLPLLADRLSKVLSFDADGNITAVANVPTSGVTATAFAETLLDDTTAGAMLTTLGLTANGQSLVATITALGLSLAQAANAGAARTILGITFIGGEAASYLVLDIPALTPAQIAANTNNYAPGVGGFLRISSDAARTITGLTNGATGRQVTIANVGSYAITLAHQSGSSTDTNRFLFGGGFDIVLEPNAVIALIYDATTQRWRNVNSSSGSTSGGLEMTNGYDEISDFIGSSALSPNFDNWSMIAAGTAAGADLNSDVAAGHPGVLSLKTGTDADGRSRVARGNVRERLGDGEMMFEAIVKIPDLADVTDDYDVYIGMADSPSTATTEHDDGVYFKYDRDASLNWIKTTAAGGVRTSTASSVAVGTGWVKLKIVVNAAGTSAEFFIDGVSVGTVATNLPTDLRLCAGHFAILKEAGTTERRLAIDAARVRKVLTTAR